MPRSRPGTRQAPDTQPDLLREAFARSVIRGLSDTPRWLSCRYLYDSTGSEIFERITEQVEYYPTRTESLILAANAERLRDLCPSTTLVELGAGSATKTRHLLRAWTAGGRKASYLPIDISPAMLDVTCRSLRREFPSLAVRGLAGSYEQSLPLLADCSPLTLLFLGSSVGNFNEEELEEFFALLAANLADGDRLLLGIDLVKEAAVLEAAYDDEAGWSAAFALNLFARMNRELGTDLDLEAIDYVSRWNPALARVEMFARFRAAATVGLPEWRREFRLEEGEMVMVEISRKFECEAMAATASGFGFDLEETFTDPDRLFALLLLRRRQPPRAPDASRRAGLHEALAAVRTRLLDIVAPLDATQLRRQHCSILSPVVWDLGHIAAFEKEWTDRAGGAMPVGDAADPRLYDPMLQPRPVRGSLPLAGPQACFESLAAVRASTLALLEEAPLASADRLLRDGYVFSMIAQHEAQHSETILQGIQLLPSLSYQPSCRAAAPRTTDRGLDGEAFVAAGPFTMGTDDTVNAYDNERPAHVVELESYWIDVAPVTNGDWLGFLEDGGYRRRELWSTEGRRWLEESRAGHPAQWRRGRDGEWLELAFGRLEPLCLLQPVVHVSWYEASAFAEWKGKRLPAEAEWEKAAAWDLERATPRLYPWGDSAPTAQRANLDQRTFAPAAVGGFPGGASYYGCEQMLGDVWEWTSSSFLPHPGFRAFPYPEYSSVHFGGRHKVLRGGSWATPSIAMRNTFRNWDLPQRRQIFAGLRCARD